MWVGEAGSGRRQCSPGRGPSSRLGKPTGLLQMCRTSGSVGFPKITTQHNSCLLAVPSSASGTPPGGGWSGTSPTESVHRCQWHHAADVFIWLSVAPMKASVVVVVVWLAKLALLPPKSPVSSCLPRKQNMSCRCSVVRVHRRARGHEGLLLGVNCSKMDSLPFLFIIVNTDLQLLVLCKRLCVQPGTVSIVNAFNTKGTIWATILNTLH